MPTLTHASIMHIVDAFLHGTSSPVELLSDSLQTIERYDAELNTFLVLTIPSPIKRPLLGLV